MGSDVHQLANLHEAGQQLAEARAAAAKAETEAGFLRERVQQLQLELDAVQENVATEAAAEALRAVNPPSPMWLNNRERS